MTELQVGVKILVKNDGGKYLLLKRSAEKYPEVGERWDIVGGRIDAGIPLIENLRREVMEETGLVIENEPVLVAAQDILRIEGRHIVRLTYVGYANGNPVLTDEHTEYGWFTVEEMKGMDLDIYFKEVLDKWVVD
ncbi:MAG: NUDIX domain-containing protein [Candidatus Aenigmarchaeota archaeon]|nr:NUDIX domain-containing protein [Candidatus Aenigmarchaeota archaeon]